MTRKIMYYFSLLAITTNAFSQDEFSTDVTDVSKITILSPGFSYEKRIGKYQTLYGQAFMSPSFAFSWSSSMGANTYFALDPAVTVQYRYYYNAATREIKGKRTDMNSLNYVTAIIETVFSKRALQSSNVIEYNRRPVNSFGAAWGFQRNYKSRFSMDISLGVGYLFTTGSVPNASGAFKENITQFTTVGQLNFGFWLNRKG